MKFVVTKYRIVGCWYGRKIPGQEVESNCVKDILSGFCQWVRGIPHISDAEIKCDGCRPFRVFVKDCAISGDDYLVALWLSSTNRDGDVYAIDMNDPPNGVQNIARTQVKKGMMAGAPAYYFVDSAGCCIYTMRPTYALVNGRAQFDAAMRFYMARHAGKLEKEKKVSDEGTIDLFLNATGADGESLIPKFESALEKVPSAIDELKKHYHKIRKIVHIQNIARKSEDEKRSIISKVLKLFEADIESMSESEVSSSRRVKCEVDVRLEASDVDRIIARQAEASGKERFGFMMDGSQKTHWADTCIARKEVDLKIEEPLGIPPGAKDVLSAVESNRSGIVG